MMHSSRESYSGANSTHDDSEMSKVREAVNQLTKPKDIVQMIKEYTFKARPADNPENLLPTRANLVGLAVRFRDRGKSPARRLQEKRESAAAAHATLDARDRDLSLDVKKPFHSIAHNRHASVRVRNRITVTTYKTERLEASSDYGATMSPSAVPLAVANDLDVERTHESLSMKAVPDSKQPTPGADAASQMFSKVTSVLSKKRGAKSVGRGSSKGEEIRPEDAIAAYYGRLQRMEERMRQEMQEARLQAYSNLDTAVKKKEEKEKEAERLAAQEEERKRRIAAANEVTHGMLEGRKLAQNMRREFAEREEYKRQIA